MAITKLKTLRNESSCQNTTLETTQEQLAKLCQENDHRSIHLKELEVRDEEGKNKLTRFRNKSWYFFLTEPKDLHVLLYRFDKLKIQRG